MIHLKKISLLLFLLIFNNNSKEVSGEVIYKFAQNEITKSEKENSKELYGMLDKMNNASKDLDFTLRFNSNESIFYLNQVMESDISPMAISYAKNIVARGRFYYDKSTDKLLREENIYGNNTLIKNTSSSINNWQLINETKYIGKHLCYKAIRSKSKVGPTKTHQFEIIAWYCPEIPLSYGPKEYNGLPGLILELKDTHYTFYASKIKIEKDTSYTIKPLKSKNIITEAEHIERMKESYEKQ